MIKMGAVRLVEPHHSASRLETMPEFSGPGSELWSEVRAWLSSSGTSSSDTARSVTDLIEHARSTTSEVERLDDACVLGKLCGTGSSDGLQNLLALFMDASERVRRFAFTALSRAGPAAVPGLQSIIANPLKMDGVTELTEAYSCTCCAQIAERTKNIVTNARHI